MDLYSNAIIVSKKLVKEIQGGRWSRPRDQQGLIDLLKDIDARLRVAKREPLIKFRSRKDRFVATLQSEMNHPRSPSRWATSIRSVEEVDRHLVDANNLPRTPAVSEIFTSAFLPDSKDLPKKLF